MVSELNATEKVLMILKAFLPDNLPKGTLELCKQLAMTPATVSRLLGILKEYKFVKQNMDRKYELGEVFKDFGEAINESRRASQLSVIKPHLMQLNSILNENVHLEVLSGNDIKQEVQ